MKDHAYHWGPAPPCNSDQTQSWTMECCMRLKMASPTWNTHWLK